MLHQPQCVCEALIESFAAKGTQTKLAIGDRIK